MGSNTPAAGVKQYVDSAVRYRALLSKLGVEGIISNHTDYDSSIAKLQKLATRKPGEPHPFLTGRRVRAPLSDGRGRGRQSGARRDSRKIAERISKNEATKNK